MLRRARYGQARLHAMAKTVTAEKVEVETVRQRDDGLFEATGGGGKAWTSKKVMVMNDEVPGVEPTEVGCEEPLLPFTCRCKRI